MGKHLKQPVQPAKVPGVSHREIINGQEVTILPN
jgi:hypothetical protein